MERQEEIALLEELITLADAGETYNDDAVVRMPVKHYTSEDIFKREHDQIFTKRPYLVAHRSELAEIGDFVTGDVFGLPVLVSRQKDGSVKAFINVCRHRGAQLVGEASGCKKRFSCPYHAWTYKNDGTLSGVPGEAQGFPGLDKSQHNLKEIPVAERDGMIWILPRAKQSDDETIDEQHLAGVTQMMGWLDMADHRVVERSTLDCAANWKILVEGGIEAYHFKVTHRNTIGPHFMNNLSSYQTVGENMRSVLPRESLKEMSLLPPDDWSIRVHANVLYGIFPLNQFLVMQDHVAWISSQPTGPGYSKLRITTLAPNSAFKEMGEEEAQKHFGRNHGITMMTLKEDFDIGEGIQKGLESGANDYLSFGRFEGALAAFNDRVKAIIG